MLTNSLVVVIPEAVAWQSWAMARSWMSPDEARRAVLRAQQFGAPPVERSATRLRRLGVLQIDSVNVLARAHYLPFFSRWGAYDRVTLDRLAGRAPRRAFEYWGHEAALLPVELHPLFRWRMATGHSWDGPARVARENPALIADVLRAVTDLGPCSAATIEAEFAQHQVKTQDYQWGWNWSDAKRALEHLFWIGAISSAGRDSSFARRYDVTERVLPAEILRAGTPTRSEAIAELVRQSAARLAVATAAELADYYRLPIGETRSAVAELVAAGDLVPVTVPGWPPVYAPPTVIVPSAVTASALLVPFDPLIWHRDRTERLFGMRYRIEIYTPAAKRQFGYYVLPFLWRGQLAARVDLKSDRKRGVLLVQGAYAERQPTAELAAELRRHLELLAEWLGLSGVEVKTRGDLSAQLR